LGSDSDFITLIKVCISASIFQIWNILISQRVSIRIFNGDNKDLDKHYNGLTQDSACKEEA
jgi:hypothetical protein